MKDNYCPATHAVIPNRNEKMADVDKIGLGVIESDEIQD